MKIFIDDAGAFNWSKPGVSLFCGVTTIYRHYRGRGGADAYARLRPRIVCRDGAEINMLQLLASPHQVHGCIHTRTNQIAKSFVRTIRHPHSRQVAGSVQDRQLLRVPPVGLDPLTWLARNERGRRHRATMAQRCELAVDVVPATAGLVAEVELTVLREPLGHLRDVVRLVGDDANEPHRAVPPVFGYADRDGLLMDVHAYKRSDGLHLSLILLSTGEPKSCLDSSRDIQT